MVAARKPSPRRLVCFIWKPRLGQIRVVTWKCFFPAFICFGFFFFFTARFSFPQKSPFSTVRSKIACEGSFLAGHGNCHCGFVSFVLG